MRNDLNGAVVVITGASSGNGRAAAHAFARKGARLVLAARRERMLEDAAQECEALGARAAVAVPTDVADADAVRHLADVAVERFGRLDIWVNNAAVLMLGRHDRSPAEDIRRVIDVNLLGYLYGAWAALPHFRRQRRGVLINNGSFIARVPMPFGAAYVASKFGVRGMAQSLQQELSDEPGIHVCTILPSPVDTPGWHHAANYTGHRITAPSPVLDPDEVGETIVALAERPQRERYLGVSSRLAALQRRIMPGLSTRTLNLGTRLVVIRREREPIRSGNLHRPMTDGMTLRGGIQATRPGAGLARNLLLLAGVAAAGAWMLHGRRNTRRAA